jgi:hypothetical protein
MIDTVASGQLLVLTMYSPDYWHTILAHMPPFGQCKTGRMPCRHTELLNTAMPWPWSVWQATFLWLCGTPRGKPRALPTLHTSPITHPTWGYFRLFERIFYCIFENINLHGCIATDSIYIHIHLSILNFVWFGPRMKGLQHNEMRGARQGELPHMGRGNAPSKSVCTARGHNSRGHNITAMGYEPCMAPSNSNATGMKNR